MKNKFILPFLVLIALLVAACATPAAILELDGTNWELTSLNGAEVIGDEPLTLNFDGLFINGYDGCNGFGAGYDLNGSSLSFGSMNTTLMACESATDSQGGEYQSILTIITGVESISEGQLLLTAEDGSFLEYMQVEK